MSRSPAASLRRAARVLALLVLAPLAARAAEPPAIGELVTARQELHSGALAAEELSKLTGVALTPLLGLTVLGALRWFATPEAGRSQLPFHQQPWFFGPGLGLVLFLWLGHRIPFVRRGFKVFKTWENKLSGVLAMPIVSSALAVALVPSANSAVSGLLHGLVPTAWAGQGPAPGAPSSLGFGLAWLVGFALSAAVWLAGHSVYVLSLVSPASPVDWLLKGTKAGLVGVLVLAAALNPWLGLAVSVVYIAIALVIAGWSFRLMVLGWVFTLDVVLQRSRKFVPEGASLHAFSTSALAGVPPRTWGRIAPLGEAMHFVFRPWLVLPTRVVRLPPRAELAIEKGFVSPVLVATVEGSTPALLRFPPRFRPHGEALAALLGGLPLREPPLVRGWVAARAWVREQLSVRGRVAAGD